MLNRRTTRHTTWDDKEKSDDGCYVGDGHDRAEAFRLRKSHARRQRVPSQRKAPSVLSCRTERSLLVLITIVTFLSPLTVPTLRSVAAANDDYYSANDDGFKYNYYGNDNNNNNNNNNNNDDYNSYAGNDDASANDDGNNQNQNQNQANYRDDDYYLRNKQYYVDDDTANQDDAYQKEQEQYQDKDDDEFHWDENMGFDGVSIMPLSCINYNNGHMIKFQLFDSSQSYQCHFAEIATFVVSISHYMRAYFNYLALSEGQDFSLPDDAAYLNCIQLKGTANDGHALYAKIGCMERETFTSTKLQLHVYTDAQCSQPFDDGQTARQHATRGYKVGDGSIIRTKVSFRPPFYSCNSCSPDEVSETFNKKTGHWYDDDYISEHGNRQGQGDDEEENENQDGNNGNGNNDYDDNYFDDGYMAANDDVANGNYRFLAASPDDVKAYQDAFWRDVRATQSHRSLYDNYYDVGDWNMCQRVYKYGVWCDDECRALDFFRTDQWSASDVFLLVIMCVFLSAMMLLIVAKRLKAQQKVRMYGEELPMPGLPPLAMMIIFFLMLAVIITLAKLKFINETLVFAVVTCILLFIYMLKLTLFESKRPILLAAPKHDMFDNNPLDDHLFD